VQARRTIGAKSARTAVIITLCKALRKASTSIRRTSRRSRALHGPLTIVATIFVRTILTAAPPWILGTAGAYAYWTDYFGRRSTQTSQARPAQPAATPTVATNGAAGGYVVQVTARRSKADAQASFLALQSKFPRQLGGRTAIFQRADLGAKGIYYRAMVGPFASAGVADQFCGSLKAAGGGCIVQRN
jgi:hypothetical protein